MWIPLRAQPTVDSDSIKSLSQVQITFLDSITENHQNELDLKSGSFGVPVHVKYFLKLHFPTKRRILKLKYHLIGISLNGKGSKLTRVRKNRPSLQLDMHLFRWVKFASRKNQRWYLGISSNIFDQIQKSQLSRWICSIPFACL